MQNCAFGLNNLVKTASLSGSASFYAGVSAAKDFFCGYRPLCKSFLTNIDV